MGGSLFDSGTPWNLGELDTVLSRGLADQAIPGVTDPYLYVGPWKAMFGWHKEDLDLYSVNYLHLGSPKFWYSVDLDCNSKFEEFMQESLSSARSSTSRAAPFSVRSSTWSTRSRRRTWRSTTWRWRPVSPTAPSRFPS